MPNKYWIHTKKFNTVDLKTLFILYDNTIQEL